MALVCLPLFSQAQWTTNGNDIYNSNTGNVGIGTASPQFRFEVVGSQKNRNIAPSGYTTLRLYNDQDFSSRTLEIDYSGSMYGGVLLYGGPFGESAAIATTGFYPLTFGTGNTARMTITSGGGIGIGTTTPGSYKLAVAGKIAATGEVRVFTAGTTIFPDYVFAPGYKLPSLEETEKYVKQNHHLPEVPSAADIEKDGMSLNGINTILLKKVEELTLYMIDMKKENDLLKERVNKLEKK